MDNIKEWKEFNESYRDQVFRVSYWSFKHNGEPDTEWFAGYVQKIADYYNLEFEERRIETGRDTRYNTSMGGMRKGYYIRYDFDEIPESDNIDDEVHDINVHFDCGIMDKPDD